MLKQCLWILLYSVVPHRIVATRSSSFSRTAFSLGNVSPLILKYHSDVHSSSPLMQGQCQQVVSAKPCAHEYQGIFWDPKFGSRVSLEVWDLLEAQLECMHD